jgi:hypothetical protein
MYEAALETKIYAAATAAPFRPLPDYAWIHAEHRVISSARRVGHAQTASVPVALFTFTLAIQVQPHVHA